MTDEDTKPTCTSQNPFARFSGFIAAMVLLASACAAGPPGQALTTAPQLGSTSMPFVGNDPEYRGAWAQVPVILERIQVPSFPNRTLDVTDPPYGAIADGVTDARAAIQRAIIDVSRYGGGKVNIPPGKYLVDGPLRLENNVNFHLEEGAEILFGTNFDSYLPQVLTRYEGTDVYNFSPLIYVYQKTNVAITGKGKLNGQSSISWAKFVPKASDEPLTRDPGSPKSAYEQMTRDMNNTNAPVFERVFDEESKLRTSFIMFYDSDKILLEGVEIIDSPFWVNHFYMSSNITVRDIAMTSLNKNNDGIDIESSEYVHIYNVDFATGDDAVAIKSGRDLEGLRKMIPSRNIVVQNVRFLADDAIALGSEAAGGIRNVFIENSVGQDLRKGFFFKANANRGNQMEHVRIRNLEFGDLADLPENAKKLNMIHITTNYDYQSVTFDRAPKFKDMRFENLVLGRSIYPFKLEGSAGHPLRDFVFDDVQIGGGDHPNVASNVDFENNYFRSVTVSGEPLAVRADGAQEDKIIAQTDRVPPDVYAGEEQVVSLGINDTITLVGDAVSDFGAPMTFYWEAVPASSEPYPFGEDSEGNSVNFQFGDEASVSFSNPNSVSTEATFKAPGTYRLRLNATDDGLTGYHTLYIEVRE